MGMIVKGVGEKRDLTNDTLMHEKYNEIHRRRTIPLLLFIMYKKVFSILINVNSTHSSLLLFTYWNQFINFAFIPVIILKQMFNY